MVKGNIEKQNKELKGWLVGQFFPDRSPFQDSDVEIYCKVLPVGYIGDKLHVHPVGKEYLVMAEGKMRMRIGGEEVLLKKGDYIVIPSNVPDKVLEVLEPTTMFGVRCPSVPNNKTLLE